MVRGEYKNKLLKVFEVLGFSDQEREKELDLFKRRLAYDLLLALKSGLPEDQQRWLDKEMKSDNLGDPMVEEIKETVNKIYSKKDLYLKSRPLFREILKNYIDFKSSGLPQEKIDQLQKILQEF